MELLKAISTVISSKNHFIFHRDNVSLIHDKGRPVDTFYQLRCDTLEIALQMGLSSTGFIVSNIILIQRAYSPKLQVNMLEINNIPGCCRQHRLINVNYLRSTLFRKLMRSSKVQLTPVAYTPRHNNTRAIAFHSDE